MFEAESVAKVVGGVQANIQPSDMNMINSLKGIYLPEGMDFSESTSKDNLSALNKWNEEVLKMDPSFVIAKDLSGVTNTEDIVSKVRTQVKRVHDLVKDYSSHPDQLGQSELIKLQYEVTQLALLLDMASKIGDKTSQGLQSMFRNQ
jgi:hypothetical protein